jgi:hypothetical protein
MKDDDSAFLRQLLPSAEASDRTEGAERGV